MGWLALDIGGAHIKSADGRGFADSQSFALWQRPDELAMRLRMAINGAPPSDHLAITMTGELADCFATKAEGVEFILTAVEAAADGRHTRVYRHDGSLVSVAVARRDPRLAASSNWHVLARFCGRFAPHGSALLLDIGSTTCDIIPLLEGQPNPRGFHDTERLLSGELVYTGVVRSPVCALVRTIPFNGSACPVAQEVFATMRDVYLLTDDLEEDTHDCETADGRPATRDGAVGRLGRMVSAWDRDQFGLSEAMVAARSICTVQVDLISEAVQKVLHHMAQAPQSVIIAGQGSFLARRVLASANWTGSIPSLDAELGPSVSRAAPAHGLAVLADDEERAALGLV